jgi:outer membrane protein assembly factor BamA
MNHWYLCGLLAGLWAAAQAQRVDLLLTGDSSDLERLVEWASSTNLTVQRRAADTLVLSALHVGALHQALRQLVAEGHRRAYLLASVDDWEELSDSAAVARFYVGPRLYWVQLTLPEADLRWLDALGVRERPHPGEALHYEQLLRWQGLLLQRAENRGYPFAAVRLDSLYLQPDGGTSAHLTLWRGRFIAFAEPKVNGNLRLSPRYLAQFLGIKPGAPYSQERVLRIPERLRTLLFVEQTELPSITFSGDYARVNLFLQKKRASRFDLVVGLLPQPNDPAGRLLVTGALQMALLDALNSGESIRLELERLRPETQKLDAQVAFPYLLGTPFGAEGRFQLFRRDSSWTDAFGEAGVQYFLDGIDFVKFFLESRSLSLQRVDTAQVRRTRRLPEALDMRQQGAGVELNLNRLDYRFNPRKGWALWARGTAGFSRLLPNAQIEALQDPADTAFRFTTLYDGLLQRKARYQADARAEFFLPLAPRTTVLLRLRAGALLADRPLFANEQYRLGGHKWLRGFDEESLFASRFAVATAELRLLTGQNAYWAAFADWGYLENLTDRNRLFLRPWGWGAGLNVETQAGIFGISLAVGKRDSAQPFDWRAPKFHLGYVNLF